MKSFLSHAVLPLRRIWRHFARDDHKVRLAKRHSRASGWTLKRSPIGFRGNGYALILKACCTTNEGFYALIKQAALERAQFILQVEKSRRPQ